MSGIRKESAPAQEEQDWSCDGTHLGILPRGRTKRMNRCNERHGKRFAMNHLPEMTCFCCFAWALNYYMQ